MKSKKHSRKLTPELVVAGVVVLVVGAGVVGVGVVSLMPVVVGWPPSRGVDCAAPPSIIMMAGVVVLKVGAGVVGVGVVSLMVVGKSPSVSTIMMATNATVTRHECHSLADMTVGSRK